MVKLDHFLTLLQDGAWHSLQTLVTQAHVPIDNLEPLARLLADAHIIEYDARQKRVRVTEAWRKMLEITDETPKPEKAALGTVVLPPQHTFSVQGLKITNLTDHALELDLRVDDKLDELAISTVD